MKPEIVQTIFYALICIGVVVGVFMLIRSIVIWYWKIDVILKNQQKQIAQNSTQIGLMERLLKHQNLRESTVFEKTDQQ